jgi:uncharacterized lipoprotein YmbA
MLVLVAASLLFIGCASKSPPVAYYTLDPLPRTQAAAELTSAASATRIGVGPIRFPESLDRPQIVTRSAPHRLKVDEFHRWASSLSVNFSRVLTENISILMRTNRVAAFPWPDYFEPTLQVIMEVQEFVATPGQAVVLSARWAIAEPNRRSALAVRQSTIRNPLASADYAAQVAAQSAAVQTLSRQIVEELQRVKRERKAEKK